MEEVTYDIELEKVTLPTSFTLENKLIYICILEFLKPYSKKENWQEDFNLTKFKTDLQSLLITNFKYAFTKIEASINENGTLTGNVQYTGGKVLTFNLETSKLIKENEN